MLKLSLSISASHCSVQYCVSVAVNVVASAAVFDSGNGTSEA